MIADMHTHILPEIDDGADSVDMSVAMLGILQNDDVTDVVLTPHFYMRNQSMESFLNKRDQAFSKLKEAYSGNINLHLGAEVELSNAAINYDSFKELSIDRGRYILLELPFGKVFPKDFINKLESFIYQTGLTPIIAHIERYEAILRHPELVSVLIDMGCLIQINCESVIRCKAGGFEDALMSHGQAHLLGSDCHNLKSRRPRYGEALEELENRYGTECKNYILQNTEDVINGKRVYLETNVRLKKRFGKYR